VAEMSASSELRELLRGRLKGPLRAAVVLVVLGLCLLFFAVNAGKVLVMDAPEPSDIILVLAGETDHRPAKAIEMLHRGYGRRVLLDVPAEAKIFGFTDIQLAQAYVRDLHDAGSVDICPIKGLSTKAESHDVLGCLSHEQGSRILIVTSDYHSRRALDIFQHEIPGKHFSVAAAYDDHEFGPRWWTHREWAKTCFAEWAKTIWWNAVDRWH
jgi:DUF218 domain